jgi:PAS domain S-box-containing protein
VDERERSSKRGSGGITTSSVAASPLAVKVPTPPDPNTPNGPKAPSGTLGWECLYEGLPYASNYYGIYIVFEGRIDYVNDRFCEMTGYAAEELTAGDFDLNSIVKEQDDPIPTDLMGSDRIGTPARYRAKVLRREGSSEAVEIWTTRRGTHLRPFIIGFVREVED